MMSTEQNKEAHMLLMKTVKPEEVTGTNHVYFIHGNTEYELETLLEVVTFVNRFLLEER